MFPWLIWLQKFSFRKRLLTCVRLELFVEHSLENSGTESQPLISLISLAGHLAHGKKSLIFSPIQNVCKIFSAWDIWSKPKASRNLFLFKMSTGIFLCVLASQLCLTLRNCMGCSLPGSLVHGILLERILDWVAMIFSRGSSQPRDQTQGLQHCT